MEQEPNITPSEETPEIQPVIEEEETVAPPKSRSVKWFIIGGILVLFLGVAAFLGASLLKPQAANGQDGGGGNMMLSSKSGPGGKTMRLDMTPAKELPESKADTAGLFVRRQDQSIFIGTGRVSMMISKSADGSMGSPSASYDGPVVEVVITHETKVYQDITDLNPGNMDDKNGDTVKMQQIVKAGSLEDLGANSMVTVWGEKQGDRFIAKVISFR